MQENASPLIVIVKSEVKFTPVTKIESFMEFLGEVVGNVRLLGILTSAGNASPLFIPSILTKSKKNRPLVA